jgi:hypothetical protein
MAESALSSGDRFVETGSHRTTILTSPHGPSESLSRQPDDSGSFVFSEPSIYTLTSHDGATQFTSDGHWRAFER